MRKFLFLMVLVGLSLSGAEIHWEKDLSKAIERAFKEQKPLMVLVTKNGCRWCDVLKQTTLKNDKVVAVLNRDFVSYEGIVDENSVPSALITHGTPATWFIKGKTPMFEPIMGAVEREDYLKALDIVKQEYKKSANSKESK